MRRSQEKKYENLSPFELKNKLIEMAETRHEKMMLNAGWASKYTRSRLPVKMVYSEEQASRADALKREAQLKNRVLKER